MAQGDRRASTKSNASPSWCSLSSVLDVKISEERVAPFVPPIAKFLEEAILGLRAGPGDKHRREPESSPCRGVEATPAERAAKLSGLLSLDVAASVGKALFWIVFGSIFGGIPDTVIAKHREHLGSAWYLLYLGVLKEIPTDRKMRDWVLAAFPFVYAQAIYRLVYAGFEEDRKSFTQDADALLDKAVLVSHFELTGFQLTIETVRQTRKRLFLARVIQNPQMDQREVLRGQQRQEMLESNKGEDMPLVFGRRDGRGLEEKQLEDILKGRRDVLRLRNGHAPLLQKQGVAEFAMMAYAEYEIPAELSIDRYDDLPDGNALYYQKMADFNAALTSHHQDGEEGVKRSLVSRENSAHHRPQSQNPPYLASPLTPPLTPKGRNPQINFDEASDDSSPRWGSESASPSPSPKNDKTTSVTNLCGSSANVAEKKRWKHAAALVKDQLKEIKEKEVKERVYQQELLYKKAATGPLPKELCEREFYTTWVSPVAKQLLPDAEDRFVLLKRSSEAFKMTMATSQDAFLSRPSSMPSLRQVRGSSKEEKTAAGTGTVAGAADSSLPSLVPSATGGSPTGGTGILNLSTNSRAPQEIISLGPPTRVTGKLALRRLEDQKKGSAMLSFGKYMKEYDILSGKRKLQVDPKKLEEEEDSYVMKMLSMNKGPPKRMVRPASMMRGQMRSTQ